MTKLSFDNWTYIAFFSYLACPLFSQEGGGDGFMFPFNKKVSFL